MYMALGDSLTEILTAVLFVLSLCKKMRFGLLKNSSEFRYSTVLPDINEQTRAGINVVGRGKEYCAGDIKYLPSASEMSPDNEDLVPSDQDHHLEVSC
jgi:hypothetical protein